MRIAVISDVHGNLDALLAVLDDIDGRSVDGIVDLGDKVSGPLYPRETAEVMMARTITHIAGNHERQLLTLPRDRMGLSDRIADDRLTDIHRGWLRAMPATMPIADGEVLLCHGTPSSDITYLMEEIGPWGSRSATPDSIMERIGPISERVILCGHSHLPRAVTLDDGRLVVNPGSVGLQAYRDEHLFLHTNAVGSPHARYTILERRNGTWNAQLQQVIYDWDKAADRAAGLGADTWAAALRTGQISDHP